MDNVTALLLRLVRSVLTDIPVGKLEGLNEEALQQLYALAHSQELAHLACEGLKRAGALPGGELGAKFQKQRKAAIFADTRKQDVLERIGECLSRENIAYIPLKGSVMRDYYPEPWMRNRCDIDVLVHPEDLERSCLALEAIGYTRGDKYAHDISLFSPEKVHLELHFMLHRSDENLPIPLLDRVWEYASPVAPGACHYVLTDAMYYFYHVGHIAKHVRGGGCGLRPFIDIWLLDQLPDADKAGRESLLEQDGLLTFARTAGRLAEGWFTDIPCTDPVCMQLEEFIVYSGIYGKDVIRTANAQQHSSVVQQLFPSYRALSKTYQVLQTKPWLYPFCFPVHWWNGLRKKGIGGKLRQMKKHKEAYEEQHAQTKQLMESLELWK